MKVSESGKHDSLSCNQKGKLKFKEFERNGLARETAKMSIWDLMKKMKLKAFSTYKKHLIFVISWLKFKKIVDVLSLFHIIEPRPLISTNLKDSIKTTSPVIPRSLFFSDV